MVASLAERGVRYPRAILATESVAHKASHHRFRRSARSDTLRPWIPSLSMLPAGPLTVGTNWSSGIRTTAGRSGAPATRPPNRSRKPWRRPSPWRPRRAALPAAVRAAALDHVSRRLAERADEVARLITAENGKPLKWARAEVARARLDVPLGRRGGPALLRRAPAARHRPGGRRPDRRRPPVPARPGARASRPFNFPLNLVAHKVAPAIAVGAPIVLKPAPATPLSALLLGEILAETDLPAGHVLRPAGAQRPRGRARRGPPAAGRLVHRLRPGRRAIQRRRAAQARDPRTGRQRARPWSAPTGRPTRT